jgi:hypothetical protein
MGALVQFNDIVNFTMFSLWEILVPRNNNFGNEIPAAHHQVWDREVRTLSNGFTIMGTAQGEWRAPDGSLFREPMIPVRIACSRSEMDAIISFTLVHYKQKAVMAYLLSKEVLFVHAEDGD